MPSATLSAIAASGSGWSVSGAASLTEALAAQDGTKYASAPTIATSLSVTTGPLTVPYGATVTRLTVGRTGTLVGAGTRQWALSGFWGGEGVSGQSPDDFVSHSAAVNIPGTGSPVNGSISIQAPADASTGLLLDYLYLTVEWSLPNVVPGAPINLSPAENSVTQELAPLFSGTRVDADGDPMNAVDIDVRQVSGGSVRWASGWLTVSPNSSVFSKPYAGTALTEGFLYKWRARTRDIRGAEGPWSAYVTFTANKNDAPTATQISPAADAQPGDVTPDFTFGWSDPDPGDEFGGYQLGVRRKSDSVTFWTGPQANTTAAQKTARQATVTYGAGGGASALVSGTEYQWRVRVKDKWGLWSGYTGWRDFTPSLKPNPPLLTSPVDTAVGATNTLTPTISGVYQQAAGGAEAGYQYELRSGTTTIYASGDVAGALGTGQAYGTANPADTPSTPPALSWGQTYTIRVRSKDTIGAYSDWTPWLTWRTNAAPLSPSAIVPGNGQVINDTTPLISWVHQDPDGDAQTSVDIEIYDVTAAAYVTGYNPKTVAGAAASHTVSPPLVEPHAYQLRVRTTGLAGPGAGAWSAPVQWAVADAVNVAVTSLTEDGTVTGSNPTITWTFSGGSGVQANHRVVVYASDGVTVLHDSGVIVGTALSYVVPAGAIHNGEDYYVQVFAEDTLGLDGQSAQVRFTGDFTPPASITGLAAQAIGGRS